MTIRTHTPLIEIVIHLQSLSYSYEKKNIIFKTIPTTVDVGAAIPIFVRLALGWILMI